MKSVVVKQVFFKILGFEVTMRISLRNIKKIAKRKREFQSFIQRYEGVHYELSDLKITED